MRWKVSRSKDLPHSQSQSSVQRVLPRLQYTDISWMFFTASLERTAALRRRKGEKEERPGEGVLVGCVVRPMIREGVF